MPSYNKFILNNRPLYLCPYNDVWYNICLSKQCYFSSSVLYFSKWHYSMPYSSSKMSGSCLVFLPQCSPPLIHQSVPLNLHSEISHEYLYCYPSGLLSLFAITNNATMNKPVYMLFHVWAGGTIEWTTRNGIAR